MAMESQKLPFYGHLLTILYTYKSEFLITWKLKKKILWYYILHCTDCLKLLGGGDQDNSSKGMVFKESFADFLIGELSNDRPVPFTYLTVANSIKHIWFSKKIKK